MRFGKLKDDGTLELLKMPIIDENGNHVITQNEEYIRALGYVPISELKIPSNNTEQAQEPNEFEQMQKEITDIQLALCEIYETTGGGNNG